MRTVVLPHFDAAVHVGLFAGVENAAAIREHLSAGDPAYEYAFVDAELVTSELHLLAAVHRALDAREKHQLKTRNVHSEMITDALRRFGISSTSRALIAVRVDGERSDHERALAGLVHGQQVDFSDATLEEYTDPGRVQRLYKTGDVEPRQLPWACISSMALKGIA